MSLLNFMAVIFMVICVEVYIGLHIMEQLHLDCENKIQMLKYKLQDLSEKVEELEKKHNEILTEECASNPCMNGATCIDGIKSYSCICLAGYNGKNCQTAVYYGTSFITGFMKHSNDNLGKPTLLIACPEGTANIYVSIPALSIVNEHHVLNGGALTLEYSNTSTSYTSGVISNKGVHIIADRPVMLFAGSIKKTSADGSMVPPEISLGTDYIISGYPSDDMDYKTTDEFLIVGTKDMTIITMNIKSVTANITLNRMETYMRAEHNLSGSMIFSSAPVYVLSGHSCAFIPNFEVKACDYIDEAMPPISSLGKRHVVSYMKPRPDFTISIAAPFSNTSVAISDATGTRIETITSMKQTDAKFRTFTSSQTISVVATQPILVTQYGHGSGKKIGHSGDPSMMKIPDVTHFGHMYHFVVPSKFKRTLVIVMRSLYATSDLLLDDVVFKANKTISAKITDYDDYRILYGGIAPGYHKLAHKAGTTVSFGAWIYGRHEYAEYAWSLGHT